jgi:hypothetical protein
LYLDEIGVGCVWVGDFGGYREVLERYLRFKMEIREKNGEEIGISN